MGHFACSEHQKLKNGPHIVCRALLGGLQILYQPTISFALMMVDWVWLVSVLTQWVGAPAGGSLNMDRTSLPYIPKYGSANGGRDNPDQENFGRPLLVDAQAVRFPTVLSFGKSSATRMVTVLTGN
jgi:hypothetical protein